MPVREFSEAISDVDQPMEEFRELAAEHSGGLNGRAIVFTEPLMRSLAGEGLSVIRYHARRGSLKAAMYLVDRCLGVPDQPFNAKVASMSREEAEAALFQEFRDQGFSEETARGLVKAASALPTPDSLA